MSDDYSHQLKLVTAPASEPVTLSQAKAFLRVEHSAEDAVITTAIVTARQHAEQYLRASLLPQTWDYSLANPSTTTLALPRGPATSITSISLTNESGTTTVMNPANYRLSVSGRSVLFTNAPSIEKLTIRFVASLYAAAADVPAPIVQGILHHVAALVEQRDGAVGMPMQSVTCFSPYRLVTL